MNYYNTKRRDGNASKKGKEISKEKDRKKEEEIRVVILHYFFIV
jgi:hypothetical protein